MKYRLDNLLVQKGLFNSRAKSVMAITDGIVQVDGNVETNKSRLVEENADIKICGEPLKYVSRGGIKLEKAILKFNLDLKNKIVLDLGSSTGGFTDCALQNGARQVIAVDIGSNQLVQELVANPSVIALQNTDVRKLNKKYINSADIVVCDISFVSLTKVLQNIIDNARVNTPFMLLIKPQFEAGLELIKKCKGVIKDVNISLFIANKVVKQLEDMGLKLQQMCESPIKGGDGNTEYITLFTKN